VSPLILKRASASRPSGQWKDEDYDVIADGKVVGRIYEDGCLRRAMSQNKWFWSARNNTRHPRFTQNSAERAAIYCASISADHVAADRHEAQG
jgi:hypothetical protein